ncbi:MAG: ATP-binding protein, partial [Lachnospiraceae bacterium]|nr:ATP-binding protein [Lachnospiraceae bacterium]
KKGNKGLKKDMYLLITFKPAGNKVKSKANEIAGRIKNDLYDKLGISSVMLNGYERLEILFSMINTSMKEKLILDLDQVKNGGLSEKDQIIYHPFVFGKKPDRFETGQKAGCVAYLKLDASQLSDRFLTKFLDLDCEIVLSIHIEPVYREKATKDVRRLVSDLQKMVIDEQRDASNRGYSMTNVSAPLKADLEAAEKTLSGLTQNDEKMFMAVITMVFTEDNLTRLERDFSYAKALANEENCELIKLDHMQEDGFFSALPIGVNRINIKRQLTTTSLGLFLPFKIRELVQFGDSLCFGANKITGNIITADIKSLPNPNTIVLGTPGRGKSFAVKMMILQIFLKLKDEIIISDPEGEYSPLVRLLNGLVIKLSQAGRNYINPLDISPDCDWEADPISDKSQLMMSIYEQILGPGKGEANDKSIIDRCIRKIYAKFVETKNKDDIPILEDFYNELSNQSGERAQFLKEALEVYVHGGLNFFNHRTNVDTANRIICFDIKELGEQLKSLAMLIVQESVWNRVAVNRSNRIYTWYISDEFHLLLKDPQTALYSKEIYKRFRKWGGIPVAITQNVSDLLDSSQAQSIFYNSDCYILLGQATGDADRLHDALKLSNDQYKCILTRNKGEGLLIFGDTILPFVNRIDEKTYTYRLLTTKVTEAEV